MPTSMTRMFVHFVWGTYQRTPWLVGPVRDLAFRTIISECEKAHVQVLTLNGIEDHVHLSVKIPPTVAAAAFIGKVKGISSYAITHHWLNEPFKWQEAYGAFTVSPSAVPTVIGYIGNQQAHHAFCHEHVLDTRAP